MLHMPYNTMHSLKHDIYYAYTYTGEPATQMTLNTFHNSGIGAKNVTLGMYIL